MGLMSKQSDPAVPNPSRKPTDLEQNHDAESDDHNMIIGSLALLLALVTIVIAILHYRRDRRARHEIDPSNVDVRRSSVPLGMMLFNVHIAGPRLIVWIEAVVVERSIGSTRLEA